MVRGLSPAFWLLAVREALAGALLMIVRHYPGPVGTRLRHRYYRRRLGALGPGTRIDEGVHIVAPEHVYIGRNCWIAANAFLAAGPPNTKNREVIRRPNPDYPGREGELHLADYAGVAPQVVINAHGGVYMGENAAVSAGAKLYSASHHYRDATGVPGVPMYAAGMRPDARQCLLVGPIVVGSDSFVGSNAVVMPGVTIEPKTWLAAGGIATKRLEAGRVYRPPPTDPIS